MHSVGRGHIAPRGDGKRSRGERERGERERGEREREGEQERERERLSVNGRASYVWTKLSPRLSVSDFFLTAFQGTPSAELTRRNGIWGPSGRALRRR